jgi:hypothetical protein
MIVLALGSMLVVGSLLTASVLVSAATDGRAQAAEPVQVELTDEQINAIADAVAERIDVPDLVEIAQLLRDALQPILDRLGEILDLLKARAAASPTIETTESAAGAGATPYFEVSVPLNCRSGPGMVYRVIGYLSPQDKAEVVGQPTESSWLWWQVSLPANPDRVCWSSATYNGGQPTGTFVGDANAVPRVVPPPAPTPVPEDDDDDRSRHRACPEGIQESHAAVVDEVWTPSGEWRVVNFWSNQVDPNFTDHKLLLEPGQNPGLLGGGSSWSWPDNCGDAAHANYEANGLDPVKLSELEDMGLVK